MQVKQSLKFKISGYLLIFISLLITVELAAYLLAHYGVQSYLIYTPPEKEVLAQYDTYMANRHPLLGWPSANDKRFDISGARISPAFPTPGHACLSLYGDSFTWGTGADHAHTWGNLLSQQLGCRVANYGVFGYGADQAYLRFRNHEDEAPVVILTLFSENILRHINQLAMLRTGDKEVRSFKPRFTLNDQHQLQLIPLPILTKDEFEELFANPEKYLHYEYFLPNTATGPHSLSFPYTYFIIKTLLNERMRAKILGSPPYTPFYSSNHPSKALQLTAKIVERFVEYAQAQGKKAHVFLLPGSNDNFYYEKHKQWIFQPLANLLVTKGIKPYNLGSALRERRTTSNICEFSEEPATCGGHFSEKGHKVLAEIVERYLR